MAINFIMKDGTTQQAVSGVDFRPFVFTTPAGLVDDNWIVAINSANANVAMVQASQCEMVLNTSL